MDIHNLIKKYFAGETSLSEEILLRGMLADPMYTGEDVDEARAVTGYFARAKKNKRARWRVKTKIAVTAAASICVLLGAGITWSVVSASPDEDSCITYANGKEVYGKDVIRIVETEMTLFAEASDEVYKSISDEISLFSDEKD